MALMVAACFLNQGVDGKQGDEKLGTYINACRQLIEWNDTGMEDTDLKDQFLKCLYQLNGHIQSVIELPNLESEMIEKRHACIFYDDKYLYMSDVLLHRVAKPLLELESPLKIKKALVEGGILKPDNVGYVSKMRYYTAYGKQESVRMLCFYIEEVHLLGELRFIDVCLGGSDNDEN